jgi:hypothetical protein
MEEGQILVEVHGLRTQEEAFPGGILVGAFHKADHQIDRLVGAVAAVVPVVAVVVLIDGHLIFYHYSFSAPIYQLVLGTKLELRLFPLVGPM